MAARRKRSWIAIGGATAAVAIGAFAAIAWAAPTLTAPPLTHLPVNLSWGDDDTATSYALSRAPGTCAAPGAPTDVPLPSPTQMSFADSPGDGHYCYSVTGTYAVNPPTTSSKDVWVDNTPPTVPAFSAPIFAGAVVHGTVTLIATSSDPSPDPAGGSGVTSTTILVNGAVFATGVTTALAPWHPSSDGAYTLTATAVDAAGNQSTTAPIVVTVDNTPPGAPVVHPFQSPTTGSPILMWTAVQGETYHVARTSSTGPGARAFTDPAAPGWQDPDTLPVGTYTYVVTATDPVGNAASSAPPTTVTVINVTKTAPRSISANSPTNTVPHLTWQPPVSFLVGGWNIYRDGALLTSLGDASASSFDDTGLAAQGPHTYAVQAVNDTQSGDISSPVSVTFDTMAPSLDPATATANPDGSVSLNWPDATDPSPGSGVASYVVRRTTGSSAPTAPSAGTAVCSPKPPANGCVDDATKNNTTYSYGVFAIDGAGNVAFRSATARAVDSQAPDPLAGVKIVSFARNYVRIGWTIPAFKGADADVTGYRVLQLRTVGKAPANPNDGSIVCRNDDPKDGLCDVLNLVTGKKVSFAVYAFDAVPNYSAPVIISMTPHNTDNTPPHKPTKVRLTHSGLTYTLRWVSPRDKDLSKFRVTLYDKKPPSRPSLGKAVITGRVLHATFALAAGRRVYVTLWALDVSGNYSKVTKLVVAPGAIVPKSKHKVAKKKAAVTKKTVAKKKPPKEKPVTVSIGNG
jgi:hypothetical protein